MLYRLVPKLGIAELDIASAIAIYVSYNGNKLISQGGAMRFNHNYNHSAPFIWTDFQIEARKKFAKMYAYLKDQGLLKAISEAQLYSENQSSPMRTVLDWEVLSSIEQQRLQNLGMVQPLLYQPSPRVSTSFAYQQWLNKIMLMFPLPRNEWKSNA